MRVENLLCATARSRSLYSVWRLFRSICVASGLGHMSRICIPLLLDICAHGKHKRNVLVLCIIMPFFSLTDAAAGDVSVAGVQLRFNLICLIATYCLRLPTCGTGFGTSKTVWAGSQSKRVR
ncbi:unnamed protein product [Strongylus vulgaris]|uniref:Uncharacterized protein n=1 Tax=Strongylus vulgaris TaxID=40348 RepID=A0A3P7J204_STRVU|nr:unnamed protein product [Strongylus vulgaris]